MGIVCSLLVASAIYLPALGRFALWEPDEGRYAEIAREMVIGGDYLTPRDDWVRYFEKPPLVYWLCAGSIRMFGNTEFAARLPIALASIGQVGLTFALGQAMFGPYVAMLSALCLGLSPLFMGFARFVTLDPPLAFFVTAAMACFYLWSRLGKGGANRRWMLAAAVMLALGTLAKGPVALALCGLAATAYMLVEGRLAELKSVPWITGGAIYLVITAPWFILVERQNPGFARFFFVHEHLQRYAASTEHAQGPHFFIIVLLAGLWPWIFFAAWSLPRRTAAPDERPGEASLRLCWMWAAVVLIFFSIARSKLGSYILPGLPPMAIIAGCGLDRLLKRGATGAGAMALLAAINWLILGVAVAVALVMSNNRAVHRVRLSMVAGSVALAAGTTAAAWCVHRGRRECCVGCLAGAMVGLYVAMNVARVRAAPLNSYRQLAQTITPRLQAGCRLASYRHFVQSLPFYTGAREALVGFRGELEPQSWSPDAAASFIGDDRLLQQLWRSDQCMILIVNHNDLVDVAPKLDPLPFIVGFEGKKLALTNSPTVGKFAAPKVGK